MVDYICNEVKPPIVKEQIDKAWWIANSRRKFSVKSTWDILRNKNGQREVKKDYGLMGYPLKLISFSGSYEKGAFLHMIISRD